MKKSLIFLVFVFLLAVGFVSAKDLYVDQNSVHGACSDSYTRDQNDFTHPWCTITKANELHSGGDHIYILPGIYRESIFPKSGSSGSYTIYSGYGDRSQVKVLGSEEVTGWTKCTTSDPNCVGVSTSVYYAPMPVVPQPRCERYDVALPGQHCFTESGFIKCDSMPTTDCFQDTTYIYRRADFSGGMHQSTADASWITQGSFYYDYENNLVYLWPPTNDNPSSYTIECSARRIAPWNEYETAYKPSYFTYYGLSYVKVQNLTVMQSLSNGFTMDSTNHDIIFDSNEIAYNSGQGSCLNNPSMIIHHYHSNNEPNIIVTNNLIHHGLSDKSYGYETSGQYESIGLAFYSIGSGSLVENNTVHDLVLPIYLKGPTNDVKIIRNIVSNYSQSGITVWSGSSNAFIAENIVGDSMSLGGIAFDISTGQNAIVTNNIGYNFDNKAFYISGSSVIPNAQTIKNNIMSSRSFWEFLIPPSESFYPTINDSDFNIFYDPGDGFNASMSGVDYNSLSSWQSTGNDLNSLTSDPQFVNPDNGDFRLQPTSPAIDAGTIIPGFHCSLSDDNGGKSLTNCRHWSGAAPDIGAIEYVSNEVSQCAEGEITSECQCGNINASVGLCCDAGSEMIWFDPYYKNLGGCPSGNYYYVEQNNPAASDLNPGTKDLPWVNPARGVCGNTDGQCFYQTNPGLGINAGDVLLIKEGEYAVPGIYGSAYAPALNPSHSGTPGNYITFRSYPGDKVNLTAAQSVIGSNGRSYIVWDGFTLYSTCNCEQGMPVIIVGKNTLSSIPDIKERPDLYITDIVVMNNDIIGQYVDTSNIYVGVRTDQGVNHTIIRNNYIHDFWGNNQNQGGIQLYTTYNSIFENNLIENCRIGFEHKGQGTRSVVRYNVFDGNIEAIAPVNYENVSLGGAMQYAYNNIVKNCRSGGNAVVAGGWGTYYFKFYNNDFYNCTRGIKIGDYAVPPTSDINFFNNIHYDITYPQHFDADANAFDFFSDFSNFYSYSSFYNSEYPVGGLSNWQSQTNQDLNSTEVDPQFVSPGEDFHLQPGSPMWDLGMDLQDYDNDGDTSERIPAGAYITGDEVIGLINNTAVSWNPPEPPQPGSSADVNGDGVVDIRDLALSVYWQGKDDTNEPNWGWFSHLDLNGDGRINWGDVWEIISRI